MAKNNKFNYKSIEELKSKIKELDVNIPVIDDTNILKESIQVQGREIPNRLAIHPMEGADANPDGTPGELTRRRYERFVVGGAGLIWFEAIAINDKGRANKQQLYLNEDTVSEFKKLVKVVKDKGKELYGKEPYLVIQLTHAGRFGEHNQIVFHHELVDKAGRVPSDKDVMTDAELENLEDDFVRASHLAQEAGFDAVDIKSCHRYLLSELLAAHTREGKYGGSYTNRTRLLKNAVRKVADEMDITIATRLNIFDAIPYPYGWGTDDQGQEKLAEPRKLVRELENLGVRLINITACTPYLWPHINRPYDQPNNLGYESPEHPMVGVERLLRLGRTVSEETNECLVVGTGFSWLRQFAPQVAAAVIKKGWTDLAGFGRMAFAYPDFARDILADNNLDTRKVCVTCSKCAELKAKKKHSGCVVRDTEVYLPIYQELLKEYKKN